MNSNAAYNNKKNTSLFIVILYLMWNIFATQKVLLVLYVICGLIAEILSVLIPKVTGDLIEAFQGKTPGNLYFLGHATVKGTAYLFVFVGSVQFLFAIFKDTFEQLLKNRLSRDLGCLLHSKLIAMDADYYAIHSSGEQILNLERVDEVILSLKECLAFPIVYLGGCLYGIWVFWDSLFF